VTNQLRIFIDDVDLVCYGRLDNPHVRQLDTWANKCAGRLEMKVLENKSAPPSTGSPGPGRYEVTSIPSAGRCGCFVATAPSFPVTGGPSSKLAVLEKGAIVNVLEVVTPVLQPGWEASYAAFVYGRVDFNGQTGGIPLRDTKGEKQEFVTRSDAERLSKLELCRQYIVERGDGKCFCQDTSQIWFAEEKDRDAFAAAFSSWERDNPQPRLRCGFPG